eukprot:m.164054 g.164054  ORF g.164054 m.164054 type:complete len:747 (+) comp15221_c0_seq19:134-2374(+)
MAEHALQQLRLDEKAQEEVSVEKRQENEASVPVAPQEEGATLATCAKAGLPCGHPRVGSGPCVCVKIKALQLKQKSAGGLSSEEVAELGELFQQAEPLWINQKILRVHRNDPTLKELRLGVNLVSSDQVLGLFTALEHNTTLKLLSLGDIQINKPAAAALANSLKVNTRLTQLKLRHAELKGQSASLIYEALKSNNTLKILATHDGFLDAGFQILRARNNDRTLTCMTLRRTNGLPPVYRLHDQMLCDAAEALRGNTFVSSLIAENQAIGLQGAEALAKIVRDKPTVTEVKLSGLSMDLRKLEDLIAVLKQHPTQVTVANKSFNFILLLGRLMRNDPSLDKLDLRLSDDCISANAGRLLAAALKGNTRVTSLSYLAAGSSHFHSFWQSVFGDDGAVALVEVLKANKSLPLSELKLIDCSIGAAGALALADLLKTNTVLREIDLTRNDLTPTAVAAFTEVLWSNTTLIKFEASANLNTIVQINRVSRNDRFLFGLFDTRELTDELAIRLAKALSQNTSMTHLRISLSHLTDVGLIGLTKAIAANRVLQTLYLVGNRAQAPQVQAHVGLREFFRMLGENTTVHTLDITGTYLDGEVIVSLAEVLKTNSTLKKLILDYCDLDDAMVVVLATALEYNSTLTSLSMRHNRFRSSGVIALAHTLQVSMALTELNLSSEQLMSVEVFDAMIEALKVNTCLQTLILGVPNGLEATRKLQVIVTMLRDPAREHAASSAWGDTKPASEIPLAEEAP